MAILEIAQGQSVLIPAVQLTTGQEFAGLVKTRDGETLVIELDASGNGLIPAIIDEMCVLTWQSEGIQQACPLLVRSHTQRAIVGQIVIQERRESPRIRVEMQVSYAAILEGELKSVADEVMARVHTLGDPVNEVNNLLRHDQDPLTLIREEITSLRDAINEMIHRLDNLTAIVTGNQSSETGRVKRPLNIMNCSSTGIGLLTRENHQEGEYLRLQMVLRTVPQTVIECIGVVVRCIPLEKQEGCSEPDRFDLGIRFTHIHESDRERLIHYIFKAQRRVLRDMRECHEAQMQAV